MCWLMSLRFEEHLYDYPIKSTNLRHNNNSDVFANVMNFLATRTAYHAKAENSAEFSAHLSHAAAKAPSGAATERQRDLPVESRSSEVPPEYAKQCQDSPRMVQARLRTRLSLTFCNEAHTVAPRATCSTFFVANKFDIAEFEVHDTGIALV